MFGLSMLEGILVLVVVYAVLALVCSTVGEWVAAYLHWRPNVLHAGLRGLLLEARDSDGQDLADRFFNAPLIRSLSPPFHRPASGHPSYLPARAFTETLLQLIKPSQWGGEPMTFNDFTRIVERLPDSDLKTALQTIGCNSGHDVGRVRQNLDAWFDSTMDRATGWYKRRMGALSLAIATVLCFGLRVDPFAIMGKVLAEAQGRSVSAALAAPDHRDRPVTTAASAPEAPAMAPDRSTAKERQRPAEPTAATPTTRPQAPEEPSGTRTALNLPRRVTWAFPPEVPGSVPEPDNLEDQGSPIQHLISRALGLLLSTVIVAIGSPLCFDFLNRFTNTRLCGRPPSERPWRPDTLV
jgi:hypothetical protein